MTYLRDLLSVPNGLSVCSKCSAVVWDEHEHDNFHIELRNAASNATRANDRLDEIE